MPAKTTVTPIHVADLMVGEDTWMPVFIHLIDHPSGRVLVDTGLTDVHPAVADMDPRPKPVGDWGFDPESVAMVVNTHLHFDHCGGNHLFAGKPIYVQRRELEDARTQLEYTIPEWVDARGVSYVETDGDRELLPGIRLVATPGHTPGSQVVVVETAGGAVALVGDTAITSADLDEPQTEGQRIVRALNPQMAYLSHQTEPWRPRLTDQG